MIYSLKSIEEPVNDFTGQFPVASVCMQLNSCLVTPADLQKIAKTHRF
jgi:hypothetical protein